MAFSDAPVSKRHPPATALSSGADGVKDALAKPEVHERWEQTYRTDENGAFFETTIDHLSRYLPAAQGARLLDAGCGGGAYAVRLARRGFDVEAVDFSEYVLNNAKRRVANERLASSITVRPGDVTSLSYADWSFDCVLCWGVLMHVPDVSGAVAELCRVTKPTGTLVVCEVNMRSPETWVDRLAAKLGKHRVEMRRTAAGIETWVEYGSGPIVRRHANIKWLKSELQSNGFDEISRVSGQFTHMYKWLPPGPPANAAHILNRFWLTRVKLPYLAVTNVIVARRNQGRRDNTSEVSAASSEGNGIAIAPGSA